MISDVLSDAVHEINDYRKSMPQVYADPSMKRRLDALVLHMETIRIDLDTPPKVTR